MVAIDPRTGEILAFVSKPTFDPNLFVEGIDADNWKALNESLDKPLLNRALRGTYPPGSTYKPFMSLAALEAGKRTSTQTISDPGYFMFGNHRFRDDKEGEYGFPAERVLVHGTIDHGTQLARPGSDRIPTSYFGSGAGISRALSALHATRGGIRIGILGLGAGVTATLADKGDTLHYYEINPLILDIATHQFGFFNACPAKPQVFMGDARLVLESLPSEQLDFLAMDAFTSDAVPAHLLTREAYTTYLRHLKPDGILAVHI